MPNRKQNILLNLRNREQGSRFSPYSLSLNVVGKLIRSKDTKYKRIFSKKTNSPICYDTGHFYFNNYTECYTLYGRGSKPSLAYNLKRVTAKVKIIDAISYAASVLNVMHQDSENNVPLTRYIICITKENWLCQYKWSSGHLLNEIYVRPFMHNFNFMHCDWNTYAKQFVLTSGLNPKCHNVDSNNVAATLAVFNANPLEFVAMFDMKRNVFGKNLRHVNVSNQMLVLGMGTQGVHMYNFNDVLIGGTIHPYKLGENYEVHGRVGIFPMGIPHNLTIDSAPPLLFKVLGYDQTIDFGGFPFHYIHLKKYEDTYYIVRTLKENTLAKNGSIKSSLWLSDNGYAVSFHPDGSNRIIQRTTHYVHCYKINSNSIGETELKKVHSMGFPECNMMSSSKYSLYGRIITRRLVLGEYEKFVLATDYEDELDLFGILGIMPGDPSSTGFVKLYNSLTGKELKCINLEKTLSDTNRYELHVDRDSIIIIERDLCNNFFAFVYQLQPEMLK